MFLFFPAVTCTGRPCYWLKHHPGRDPAFIKDKTEYRNSLYFIRRTTFDPSPTQYQDYDDISPEKLASFVAMLKEKLPNCSWLYHLDNEPVLPLESNSADTDADNPEDCRGLLHRAGTSVNQVL